MKMPSTNKIFVVLGFLLSSLTEAHAASTCFSFIPYANNNLFVQLPESKNFCFRYSEKKTHISTDKFGGRIIAGTKGHKEIIAFGESQMLGLDFSDHDTISKHDLSGLFPSAPITIYAAPNNGPLQAIEQIRDVHHANPITNKRILIGFNYGTDIFRIQSDWKPERFVPLDMTQLERSFTIPGYHDVVLFIARVRGVKFGSTVSNSRAVRSFYENIGDHRRGQNIENWLHKLKSSKIKLASTRDFILYPPYWFVGANDQAKSKFKIDYYAFACKVFNSNIFDSVIVAKLPTEATKLATDNRHFLTGALVYKNFSC